MNKILKLGVPIVLASGNRGRLGRKDIDQIPQVFEKDTFPVINVGSATLHGKAMDWSQGQGTGQGTQLTIYGVGDKVEVHDHHDGQGTTASGTSYAAPAVAGIIAAHLDYNPWDPRKTGLDRVKEIKRWLTTSERASSVLKTKFSLSTW
jgi:subtilisin family serine protease